MRGGMGTWADWTSGLSAVLSGGISLVAPQIEAATGWDLNANNSPVFREYVVPVANQVGNYMGYGPAGDYLSGTAQAIAGKVPLPIAWTGGKQLDADFLDKLTATPTAPPVQTIVLPSKASPQARAALTAAGYRTNTWPRYYFKKGA